MSDHHRPARIDGVHDGLPAGDQRAPGALAPTEVHRPETGSALARLLHRQVLPAGGSRLLGFVPAQVR